jgi:hypothetical protein
MGSPHAIAVDSAAIPGHGAAGRPAGHRGGTGAANAGSSTVSTTQRFVEPPVRFFIFWFF